jgi:hypothetical protein
MLDGTKELRDVQCRTTAVAGYDGRDSHADEILRSRHVGNVVSVSVDVNETRGNDEAGSVDFNLGLTANPADGRDASLLDRHIGEEDRIAGSVSDPAMADNHVVALGMEAQREIDRQQGQHQSGTALHRLVYTAGCDGAPE